MAMISVEVPDDLAERLAAFAARTQSTADDVIRRVVLETLEGEQDLGDMVARGKADLAAGRVVPHEDVMAELEAWARGLRGPAR